MLFQLFFPTVTLALTGGPSQPEVQSFEPIGTTEMVDLFTGDFTYNIPLLDVGGYPVNMSYHAGPSMDQEASWVGLGWNINPGVINRNMRGIPDDFNGSEKITQELNMNPNWTIGVNTGFGFEVAGLDNIGVSLGFSLGVKYNNYVGVGFDQGLSIGLTAGKESKSGNSAGLGLNLSSSADGGLTIAPSLSYSRRVSNNADGATQLGISVGVSFNSRAGLGDLTINKTAKSTRTDMVLGDDSQGPPEFLGFDTYAAGSASMGSSMSFASPTYTPSTDMSFIANAISGKISVGGTVNTVDISGDIGIYYSRQELLNKEVENPAYGYLFSHNGQNDVRGVHDFNREKDRPYMQGATANLPVTNFTYDMFNAVGQGVAGQYRPYRSDVGYVYDPKSITVSNSGSFGVEVDAGNMVHAGGNFNLTNTTSENNRWTSLNDAESRLGFSGSNSNSDIDYEPAYFRQVGELSVEPVNETFRSKVADYEVIDVELKERAPFALGATKKFRLGVQGNSTQTINSNGITRDERVKKNQVFSYLTIAEAKEFGLHKESLYDIPGSFIEQAGNDIGHHIGEVTITRADGTRYVYGLPAYNTEHKEVSFNISGTDEDASTGLVDYTEGSDNTTGNSNGKDHFFSATNTPAYAHSYLLTAIVTPDYVDVTGNGPSLDDMGNYTLFEYNLDETGSQEGPIDYGWRTPYQHANYSEGIRPLNYDDKANYIYGRKEIWYLSNISTRTQVAEFVLNEDTDPRLDSEGVAGEDGGVGERLQELKEIHLYSRPDYEENGSNAEKIKSVHFDYDHSLCNGIDNYSSSTSENGQGKLTLRKLWFTYGESKKGEFSPYRFNYGLGVENPNYHIKGYDRWGNYKAVPSTQAVLGGEPTNAQFPYVDQGNADTYAKAWNLKEVILPSGGKISVEYEADDYAYVQDKRAGQMFKVVGIRHCGDDPTLAVMNDPTGTEDLYDSDGEPNLYLFFQTHDDLVDSDQVVRDYFNQDILETLYFRFAVHLTDESLDPAFVSGYAEVDTDNGNPIVGKLSANVGYVKLRGVPINGNGDCDNCDDGCANPISRAAWQYGRIHAGRIMNGLPEYSDAGNLADVSREMIGSSWFTTIPELWNGPHGTFHNNGYGKRAKLPQSWVRLQNPGMDRKGGGHRVASIKLHDSWDVMNSEADEEMTYGQVYDYTVEGDGISASSGVAAWEPLLGGDENSHHLPVAFSQERLLVPDDNHYLEKPFGESFFPGPMVGYSKVTVRNIAPPTGIEVTHRNTGKAVHEFYTANDYPTITKRTQIQPLRHTTIPILQLFATISMDFVAASQGYYVEVNDMHGKPESVSHFAEGSDDPYSMVSYDYQESENRKLSNKVTVIDKHPNGDDHIRTDVEVGVDMDVVADFRQSWTQTVSGGAAINGAGFLVGILPAGLLTVWPSFNMDQTLFRSAVMTKVVHRYGILEKTTVMEEGSTVETKNLAYDSETGQVLLTRTKNAFEQPLYNFTYPAHWAYDRMGPAYKNLGVNLDLIAPVGPGGTDDDYENSDGFLVVGDELAVLENGASQSIKLWVWDDDDDPTSVYLIDKNGALFTDVDEESCKVIRSGRRNMQMLPIGNVLTLNWDPSSDDQNPIDGATKLVFEDMGEEGLNVLHAEAVEYDEGWQTECTECVEADGCYGLIVDVQFQSDGDQCWLTASESGVNYTWTRIYEFGGTTTTTEIQDGSSSIYQFDNAVCAEGITNTSLTWTVEVTDANGCTGTASWVAGTPEALPAPIVTIPGTGTVTEIAVGQTVNPFIRGILGNWRPVASYAYLADRSQGKIEDDDSNSSTPMVYSGDFTTDLRVNGTYVTRDQNSPYGRIPFKPFWSINGNEDWTKDDTYWQTVSTVTKVNDLGLELENVDPLNRYSSALYGYSKTLPVAVASNAKYTEIAFDSFEDVDMNSMVREKLCLNPHLPLPGTPDDSESHTGMHSIALAPNTQVFSDTKLNHSLCDPGEEPDAPYTLKACDCVGRFSPEAIYDPLTPNEPQKFIASVWVKQDIPLVQYVTSYDEVDLTIGSDLITEAITETRSPIIDGWQQITKVFTIDEPSSAPSSAITLSFGLVAGSDITWFDDFRIQPLSSSMKGFVYDPVSLRLMAELDENNYATFYEYDEEGRLTRVKKETERGIQTIQESRTSVQKQFIQ